MSNAVAFDMAPWQPCKSNNWRCVQAKRAFEIVLGKMLQPFSRDQNDEKVPYLKALHVQWGKVLLENLPTMWASPSDINHLALKVGDLLVCEGGEVGRAAPLSEQPPDRCIIQNALHRVRNLPLGEVRFLTYLLNHAAEKGWFNVLCNRATIAHFTVEKFRDLWIHLPSAGSQQLIAKYLDEETSQIDTLIKEKERMLLLLEEKRAVLISHAVTRGLDLDVPFKPSGYPWMGDIPAHWKVKRSKQVLKERDERSITGAEELLTVSHITGVTKRSEKEVYMFEAETNEGYKRCSPGNLVINTLWAWMGAMGIAWEAGIVSPAYHVYELSSELLPGYVDALARMPVFAKEVTRFSKGVWSSRLRLYPEGLYEVRLPVPPLEEQQQIIDAIASERQQTAEMETALIKSIDLLKERRSALITAAVTGQLEIPEISSEKEVQYAH